MKKKLLVLLGVLMAAECSAKSIIVYFSRVDENYSVGVIEKGNTEIIAEMIAERTGAEMFKVERTTPYNANYNKCIEEAKQEQSKNARPEIKATKDITAYDTVYVGYPIYWSDIPMPMYTFLESVKWQGKTLIPFCTHEGSGFGSSLRTLKRICKGASLKTGLDMYGSTAQNERDNAKNQVERWLKK